MRIAFVVGRDFPTLSKTFIINQVTGLIKRGHDIDIYAEAPDSESNLQHPDVDKFNLIERTYYDPSLPKNYFERLRKSSPLLLKNLLKNPSATLSSLNFIKYSKQALSLHLLHQITPHLNKQAYDIVQCHFGYSGLKSLMLRQFGLLQGKLVTTFHGVDISSDIQRKGKHIYNQLFDQGDLFLPISEHWKNKLIQLGCNENKIFVHRMGIDCSNFSFVSRQSSENESVKLLTVSRLIEKKGVEFGIRAVAELARANYKIQYNIVGDGPLREQLRQLVQELNVSHIVTLLGWRQKSDVVKMLKDSDIFLAPSVTSYDGDQEGIPVALIEAMATGLPVVSTFHSGIPELVENEISGYLVPERDVDSLAERIGQLVQNPKMRIGMGRSGHLHVLDHYDIEKLNDRLVQIYRELYAVN